MTLPWWPVILTDMAGSLVTLGLAVWSAVLAWRWAHRKSDDVFRNYISLLTLAIVCFAISRSFGHLVKQLLLMNELPGVWKAISPFSGAVNSMTFVVIFAFGIYFHRFQRVHDEIENYRQNLELLVEARTTELAEANTSLEHEIAERRQVEEDIRQSQTVLESVLNSSNPLCITSLDFEVLQGNKAYFEIWPGQEDEQGNRVKCYEVRPGDYCHTEQCPLVLIQKGQQFVSQENTKMTAVGELRDFIVTARPYRNADGELIGIVEGFQDISIRKQAEEDLAAERERLAVTLRSIGDGVITTDINGMVVMINQVAEELTGWRQREAAGRSLTEVFNIINERTRQPCRNPVELVLESGKIIGLANHTALIAREGTERSIADSGAPIRDKDNRIIGVVLVFRDVTQQLLMENELQKAKKLESVGVLAGGIAHDFNNILMAILGNINLASLLLPPGENLHTLMMEAEKACLRAKGLTHQLLTFSKGGEPVKEAAAIPEIIRDSAEFVLHGENIVCNYEIPDDLWLVDIDRGQMSQVIQNLIINAKHAMPQGGTIQVSCENVFPGEGEPVPLPTDQRFVKVVISDNGMGIPQNLIDNIFDPYFSTKAEGTGLGLAITHSIIKKHYGFITVTSLPGKGTTFTFYLPVSVEQEVIIAVESVVRDPVEGIRRILVMDDDAMVRMVAAKMLETLGFEVLLAANGDTAVRIFRQACEDKEIIDLLIMDLTIPGGMGGKDAVKEILQLDPTARVVVASGYSNDPVMADYKAYGFMAAISKPFRLKDLEDVINQTFG
ncbi:MAG: PAS domain S-box protein [Proteobacteria bacterium]|nr:PAS domain S-box protein [Pseudomonadota bacterium]MBU1686069.1 PAS domain S-box protein [Pseudomonadota bacterium]